MTNKEYKRLSDTGIPTTTPEDVYNRLYELENAIENGTLVFLSCKVGDNFWWIRGQYPDIWTIRKEEVQAIEITEQGVSIIDMGDEEWSLSRLYFTKEEAEKALEELKDGR